MNAKIARETAREQELRLQLRNFLQWLSRKQVLVPATPEDQDEVITLWFQRQMRMNLKIVHGVIRKLTEKPATKARQPKTHWNPKWRGDRGAFCSDRIFPSMSPIKARVTCEHCLKLMRQHDHLPPEEPNK